MAACVVFGAAVVGRSWGGDFITLGLTDIEDQSEVVFVTETQYESDTISINIDYQLIDTEQLEVTRTEVRERVADIFYKKFCFVGGSGPHI